MGEIRAGQVPTEYVDAVVVGSGFGGSVATYRLADAGKQVVLMERGRSYGPGDFARSPSELSTAFWDPSEKLYGLFDAWTLRGLEGLVSSGLGGGSLIYANVLLRKDEKWFVNESPLPGGGYESWPIGYRDLEQHYQRVEDMIGVDRYPYQDTAKTNAFEQAAQAGGHTVFRPPLAVSFSTDADSPAQPGRMLPLADYGNLHGKPRTTCTLCGECDLGCNSGAKNTLDHNYLSAAAATGNADIRTLHEVRGFSRASDGSWLVRYVIHDPQHPSSTGDLPERLIRCAKLLLAAGTFGTSYLLLRNRMTLPGISPALGTRFSSNGDLLGLLFNASEQVEGRTVPRQLYGNRGPVITSTVRVADALDGNGATGRGYYLQDAGYPAFFNWLMELSQFREALPRAGKVAAKIIENRLFQRNRSSISADLAMALGPGRFSSTALPLLGMGRDVPDGRMYLREGRLAADWTLSTSQEFFESVRGAMRGIGDQLGAAFNDNPLWKAQRVVTVHPLGGAPIGANDQVGVCDPWSEVYGQPGLYVVDGAAMPGPVGPNPSLTIAAMADRACEHLLEQSWASPVVAAGSSLAGAAPEGGPVDAHTAQDPAAPVEPLNPRATSVAFTETMRGHFTLGVGEPASGLAQASLRHERMMFTLTITAKDIDRFTADPRHPASAEGFLDADVLGGHCPVLRGWFNLFVPDEQERRLMLYRLHVQSPGGRQLTLVGFKDIHDGPGVDLWPDTTTLFVQLLEGHVFPPAPEHPAASGLLAAEDPAVLGSGILYIEPLDFARQLTTFRAQGPRKVQALSAFGGLFLGSLYRSYLAPRRVRKNDHEPA
ncbi:MULTISPECIES: GMC oxidoreductase [Micrococcaceae]|uniref:GMC oxidoreductase n=1 Tax=Micrococcaceae TaxID=1268 RepID=UPI000EB5D115|nr:GMC oxidoreductase [Arthrobacter sp. AG1021]RKS22590.1 cholesterol oxidase [Arthrobacter sp. AG1021]